MKRSYWQQNIQLTSLASCHGHWVWPAWRWWVIVLVLRLTWPITALAAPTSAFSGAIQPAKAPKPFGQLQRLREHQEHHDPAAERQWSADDAAFQLQGRDPRHR